MVRSPDPRRARLAAQTLASPSLDSTVNRDRGGESWVFYGGVPWDSPWLNDQQLAHALAAEDRVLVIEPPRSPLSGLRADGRARGRGKAEWIVRPRLRRGEGGVDVLTTVALPKVGSVRSQRLSAPLVRAQVRWAMRRLGIESAWAAVGMGPQARRYKGAAKERVFVGFVSDWLEAGSDLLHQDRAALAAASRGLWQAADLLCVTSRPLQERLESRGFASRLIPHGFDDSVARMYDESAPPREYAAAGSPIMVVAGRLNKRLDVELLSALAARFPRGTLVLVGPLAARDSTRALRRLLERRNVLHLPTKSRAALPAYLRHADVLLIPYVADEWSEYSSPMKVWDYLYAGAPIVGQGCPPLAELGEPIAFPGATPEEVGAAIERALAVADAPALAARRRQLARENTWRTRAAQLRRAVEERAGVVPA